MNERIKELAEQAGYNGHYATEEFDVDEFVQLIMRECVSICKEKERPNLYGVREVENIIKQHFGVEE